jgi:methyl-accepting chemotaxis protein
VSVKINRKSNDKTSTNQATKMTSPSSVNYQERLTKSTAKLHETSNSIQQSLAMLNDIEESAIETLATLKSQGEQIKHTRERLHKVDDEVREGGTIIRRMLRWSWII